MNTVETIVNDRPSPFAHWDQNIETGLRIVLPVCRGCWIVVTTATPTAAALLLATTTVVTENIRLTQRRRRTVLFRIFVFTVGYIRQGTP